MNPIALLSNFPMKFLLAASTLVAISGLAAEPSANWPRWRGPSDNGANEYGPYPVKWDATANLLWKAPLPGKGCSTPIVWNSRIYLTAPVNGQDALLAFAGSGQPLWQTTVGAEEPGKHRNGSGSNPSPITDGQNIFVFFKSGNLAALDFEGKLRWKINLVERFGPVNLFWDFASTPVLTKSDVVVARMHAGDSWLAAFDKQTGAMHWKVARQFETPVEGDQSYASPLAFQHQDRDAVLVLGAEHLTAHDATDGKLLWSCGNFNPKGRTYLPMVASALIAGDIVVAPHGRDRDCTLHGIKLGGQGDVTATHRIWKREGVGAFVPTPAAYQGRVYVLNDRGDVECIDPATGQTHWKNALPKSSSSYYASPSVADGKLYAVREDGVVFVARVAGSFEVLAENKMEERIIASPVPVGNRLLLRGEKHLFCVAAR